MPDLSLAFLATPEGWAAMVTLIAMEVVLGIDNLIFISILTNKLPREHRERARKLDIGANLTTSRLVSLGFLAEAMHKKIASYQVTEELDSRTCPVCRYMHGKTFEVAHEYSRLITVLGIQDPQDLKSAAPWPRQDRAGLNALYSMSAAEMQNNGYGSPPYHPGCRGVLQLLGTVDEELPLGSMAVPDALNPLLDGTKGPAEVVQELAAEKPTSAVTSVRDEAIRGVGSTSDQFKSTQAAKAIQ